MIQHYYMNYTRARNYRLYCSGKKVIDMELDGGRCLFGHSPSGLSKSYKNSISRGLYAALPNAIHARVAKLATSLFPGFRAIILPDRRQVVDLLAKEVGLEVKTEVFSLFRFSASYHTAEKSGHLALWRPFAPQEENADIILPIIPQPGYASPQLILFKSDAGFHPRSIPQSSPLFLYGLYHVLLLLQRGLRYASLGSIAIMRHQPKKHRDSLGIQRPWFCEEQWQRFLPPFSTVWERTGPYVYLKTTGGEAASALRAEWEGLRAEYNGLRLPTHAEQLIILPSLASQGEQTLISSFFARTEHISKQKHEQLTIPPTGRSISANKNMNR